MLGKAAALASYARQVDDETLHRYADRIKARAIRRAGVLLREIAPQPGKRTDLKPNGGAPTRLQAANGAGLSRDQMNTALRVFAISYFPELKTATERLLERNTQSAIRSQ